MRNPIENISLLQKQLNDLQLENQILKNILDRSGISYAQEIKRLKEPETITAYDPDQGARILHPPQITEETANLFMPDSGGDRMYTQGEARLVIFRSAATSGRNLVRKNTNRRSIVRTVRIRRISN